MTVQIIQGDCLQTMLAMPPESVDAVVTDPPYGLKFMGKGWDASANIAFQPDLWRAVLRVLKPGGHLLAFGGTRTYHRLACAIEDAGFEIRDSINYLHETVLPSPLAWVYGQGFPKSLNVSKSLDEKRCLCGLSDGDRAVEEVLQSPLHGDRPPDGAPNSDVRDVRDGLGAEEPLSGHAQQDVFERMPTGTPAADHDRSQPGAPINSLRELRHPVASGAIPPSAGSENLLQSVVRGEGQSGAYGGDISSGPRSNDAGDYRQAHGASEGRDQSSVEGRRDLPQEARELRLGPIRPVPSGIGSDGSDRRLRHGAPAGDGAMDRTTFDEDGMRPPPRSRSTEQREDEPRTVAGQSDTQAGGTWARCYRCSKPRIPDGLGTALKPAMELVCVARKPLIGTVAENVLRHGVGALNIDGCRVGDFVNTTPPGTDRYNAANFEKGYRPGNYVGTGKNSPTPSAPGRWPTNVIHDGSDEVVAAFPTTTTIGHHPSRRGPGGVSTTGHQGQTDLIERHADTGSAARFFYHAKATKAERQGSKHPTVKPVALMQYLCRLVTPPGGTVLDPFAGTGTTGQAAREEGFNAILIEQEAEYVADINRRMHTTKDLFS